MRTRVAIIGAGPAGPLLSHMLHLAGIGRRSLPRQAVRTFDRLHPFSWSGVLADVAPSSDELIHARHERGFSLHNLRSEHVGRLYLQVPDDTDPAQWSDERSGSGVPNTSPPG